MCHCAGLQRSSWTWEVADLQWLPKTWFQRAAALHSQLTARDATARQAGAAATAAVLEEAATTLGIAERYQILLTFLAAVACMCVPSFACS